MTSTNVIELTSNLAEQFEQALNERARSLTDQKCRRKTLEEIQEENRKAEEELLSFFSA